MEATSNYYTVRGFACDDCLRSFARPALPESAPESALYDARKDEAYLPASWHDACDGCDRRTTVGLIWSSWSQLDY